MKTLLSLLFILGLTSCKPDEPVYECTDGATVAGYQEGRQIVDTMIIAGSDTVYGFNIREGDNLVFSYKSYGSSCFGGASGPDTTALYFEIPKNVTSFRKEDAELLSIRTYYTVSNLTTPLIVGKVTEGIVTGVSGSGGQWLITARMDVAGPEDRIVQMGFVWDFFPE